MLCGGAIETGWRGDCTDTGTGSSVLRLVLPGAFGFAAFAAVLVLYLLAVRLSGLIIFP